MLERFGGETIPSGQDVRDEMARDAEADRVEAKVYYCAICDIDGLKQAELIDNCCPYCKTEIPDAVEANDDEA